MWSERKYVSIVIDILLFMLSMNFLHYGQFILPVICLILFVDNKFRFYVYKPYAFIILCLFSLSYFLFSYKLGFYSVMGFCLPMAYYIGSNLKDKNKENIKHLVYIIAFGMSTHLVLNFFYELFAYKNIAYMFNKPSHYDFWTDEKINTTISAMYFLPIVASVGFIVLNEKNKMVKYTGIILFVISGIYCFALGRRTTLVLSMFYSVIFLALNKNRLNISKILVTFFVITICVIASYVFNVFGFKKLIDNIAIIKRIIERGINTERINILFENVGLYGTYLWGGQKISNTTGSLTHDLWGDIYDYAGIVPYVFMILFSFVILYSVFDRIRKNEDQKIKSLIVPLVTILTIQLFLEPIMSGASLFFICTIMMFVAIADMQ